MQGVNVVGRRWAQFTDPISKLRTGTPSPRSPGATIGSRTAIPSLDRIVTLMGSEGTSNTFYEGYFDLARVPMLPGSWQLIILETEPINPLYTGQYAVGPYIAIRSKPSGSDPVD